nr:alcohol dehydrogenase 2 [Quercus suber]
MALTVTQLALGRVPLGPGRDDEPLGGAAVPDAGGAGRGARRGGHGGEDGGGDGERDGGGGGPGGNQMDLGHLLDVPGVPGGPRRRLLQPEGVGLLHAGHLPAVRVRARRLRDPDPRQPAQRRRRPDAVRRRHRLQRPAQVRRQPRRLGRPARRRRRPRPPRLPDRRPRHGPARHRHRRRRQEGPRARLRRRALHRPHPRPRRGGGQGGHRRARRQSRARPDRGQRRVRQVSPPYPVPVPLSPPRDTIWRTRASLPEENPRADSAPAPRHSGMGLLSFGGTLVCVGLPEGELKPIATAFPQFLVGKEQKIVGVAVGSRKDAIETLRFAERGLVTTHFETATMADLTGIFERMDRGEIKGRVVLDLSA